MPAGPQRLLSMLGSFYPYEPDLIVRAGRLRREATFPERLLWSRLRMRQLSVRFLRQRPVDRYIVDFYCPEARLVVEVDGRSHDGAFAYDRQRQAALEAFGLRVLRVTNDEVLVNLEMVVLRIAAALETRSDCDAS